MVEDAEIGRMNIARNYSTFMINALETLSSGYNPEAARTLDKSVDILGSNFGRENGFIEFRNQVMGLAALSENGYSHRLREQMGQVRSMIHSYINDHLHQTHH